MGAIQGVNLRRATRLCLIGFRRPFDLQPRDVVKRGPDDAEWLDRNNQSGSNGDIVIDSHHRVFCSNGF